jgi:hypothetical protein
LEPARPEFPSLGTQVREYFQPLGKTACQFPSLGKRLRAKPENFLALFVPMV